jgi:DNA-binding transcriptional LysR family regulator
MATPAMATQRVVTPGLFMQGTPANMGPMGANSTVSSLLALVVIGLGIALLATTLAEGGGQVGVLIGVLFVVAGCGRLYLARRR